MTAHQRGEIWLTALGAARPGEPGKHRPAVVVSASALHSGTPADLVIVVPLSSSAAPGPLRPAVTTEEGVDSPSLAVVRAVRSVSNSRLIKRLGELTPGTLREVDHALRLTLGLR